MAQQYRNNNQGNRGQNHRNGGQRPPEEDVKVSSPYNFVPLNEHVFFPEWGQLVSHDVPFKDGISGSFEVEIEAKSPIFIRHTEYTSIDEKLMSEIRKTKPTANAENTPVQFNHILQKDKSNRYFIPGSSFRNMIRSVLEIIGFGKMSLVNELSDYSFRDMNNPNLYTVRRSANNLQMGWLKKIGNKKYIYPAGNLGNLRDNDNPNTVWQNELIDDEEIKGRQVNPLKTAKTIDKKYNLKVKFENYPLATDIGESDEEKVIVLTGQIDGKNKEFLFKNPNLIEEDEKILIDDDVFDNFDFAYANNDESGKAWKFWQKNYFNEGKFVPVFFRLNDDDEIADFGLTVLYKLSYQNGIKNLLDSQQEKWERKAPDLAESIFGNINNEKHKSRLYVSHAFSDNATPENKLREFILGSPKPTFYPFYLEQNKDSNGKIIGNFKTFNDDDAKLAGRKRYPVHFLANDSIQNFHPGKIAPEKDQNQKEDKPKIESYFLPLQAGTIFKTTISYHNLKPEELGAIISAITLHGHEESHFHNIGYAKPYGFGKIKVKINNLENQAEYMKKFEKKINDFLKNENIAEGLLATDQLKELLAMAAGKEMAKPENLRYPKLKDFAEIKKQRKGLKKFSEI